MHVRVHMCSVLMCVCVCECLFVQVVRTVRDSARTEALVLPEGRVFAEAAGQETTVHHVRRGRWEGGGGGVREGRGGEGGVREGRGGRGRECELGEMCAVLRVEGGDACANDC